MVAVYFLTGFPGTGKLTIARTLADRLEAADETVRIIDNHWIANPIFGLVPHDGVSPLPRGVWDRVGEVASAVFRTVEELTPPEWNLIFTAYLDGVTDIGFADRVETLARGRGSIYVPVRLVCEPGENARRIVAAERRQRMKSVDPDEPFRLAALGEPHSIDHPNELSLDVTHIPPSEAVQRIVSHGRQCAARIDP